MDVPPRAVASSSEVTVIRQIERQFPGWGVWRSDADRWWAFRTAANPLTIEQLRAGCRLIVQADTVDALHDAVRAEISAAHHVSDRPEGLG